LLGSKVLEA
jgi:hypothetical protein